MTDLMRSVTACPGVVASVSTTNSSCEPGFVATNLRTHVSSISAAALNRTTRVTPGVMPRQRTLRHRRGAVVQSKASVGNWDSKG